VWTRIDHQVVGRILQQHLFIDLSVAAGCSSLPSDNSGSKPDAAIHR
jgi:hypothetical protein